MIVLSVLGLKFAERFRTVACEAVCSVILPSPQAEQWHGDGETSFGSLGPRTEEAAWLVSGQSDGREGEGG